MNVLAAEGGYQVFKLGDTEWMLLILSAVTALLALAVGFYLMTRRSRRRSGHAEDDRDRHRDPGGRDGVPPAPVQDDRGDPHPARHRRLHHVDRSGRSRSSAKAHG